ncbi:MAG: universal stress protein, partial [Flavobacteriaceae bacterium]|nr:universal stress protein [Flavobacteriaceae bacterium]
MKNILLLTDFSENSVNAMRYALHLFADDVCNFFIHHVQSPSSYTTDDLILAGNTSIYDSIIKESKHKLSKLAVELEDEIKNKNFNFQTHVDYNEFTDAINKIVASKNIDLIVIGTNGVTGAQEVVFGSNTINVIRKVDCPTLVIPEGFKYKKPYEVLLPLDLDDPCSGDSFLELVEFVEKFSKVLHILRIMPQNKRSPEESKDQENFDKHLKNIEYNYHVVRNIPMSTTVDCFSQTNEIDLMA